jgi:predicted amidophosphoribosyltransferase
MSARDVVEDLLDVMLPPRCPGCGRRGAYLCAQCAEGLAAPPAAPPPEPLEWWTACFAYEGVARELVARAKYRNERRFLVVVARRLAQSLTSAPSPIDLVTWAPASASRIREHGVDHGELLARAVARITGTAVAACFVRAPGPAQTGLDGHDRRIGPRLRTIGPGAGATALAGATVLVVDDVATTGGTLAAAGRALGGEQVGAVFAATIARTPRPGPDRGARTYTPPTVASSGPIRTRLHPDRAVD